MLMSLKEQLLGSLDPTIVYVCLGLLVVLLLLAIIKKAIGIAITVGIIAVLVYCLVPAAKDFQENFHIGMADNAIEITVDGKEYTLSIEEDENEVKLKNVEIERTSEGEYNIVSSYDDGSKSYFTIPGYMRQTILNYMKKLKIDYKLIE